MADGTIGGVSRSRPYEPDDRTHEAHEAGRPSGRTNTREHAEAAARADEYFALRGAARPDTTEHVAPTCGRGVGDTRSVDPTNRAQVAAYLARFAVLDRSPSASPDEYAWLRAQVPALRAAASSFEAADREATAAKARIDAIVRPRTSFTTHDALAKELVRLKSVHPSPRDAALGAALRTRIGELTTQWCSAATTAGLRPPANGFDPYLASDRELHAAFLWTTLAGAAPRDALMADGGVLFREDVVEAMALRTRHVDDELIASYDADPGTQRMLLERELRRLGDRRECRTDETNADLVARRQTLLRLDDAKLQADIDGAVHIGLDGQLGTVDALIDYELEQRLLAMNPGTVAGSYFATIAAVSGGDTDDIRAAGAAGNALGGLAQGLAGVDVRRLGPPRTRQTSGRARPRGPGLGRTRIRARTAGAARAQGPEVSRRTTAPVAFDDKHVLNGEVKYTPSGAPRAVGFHHQAPGTESSARIVPGTQSKPNAYGVYSGTVEIKDPRTGQWVRKTSESSFFPKEWSRSEVRSAVLEAYANRTSLSADGREWMGQLRSGMRIAGFSDENGRITTAFPKQ